MGRKTTNKAKSGAISRELDRLGKNYGEISGKTRSVTKGLLERAAFMRVELAGLEEDLLLNGWTELFSQGDQAPYQRKRPTAELYNTLNANYQKIIRQLTDLLPKEPERKPEKEDDGFDAYASGREDA